MKKLILMAAGLLFASSAVMAKVRVMVTLDRVKVPSGDFIVKFYYKYGGVIEREINYAVSQVYADSRMVSDTQANPIASVGVKNKGLSDEETRYELLPNVSLSSLSNTPLYGYRQVTDLFPAMESPDVKARFSTRIISQEGGMSAIIKL